MNEDQYGVMKNPYAELGGPITSAGPYPVYHQWRSLGPLCWRDELFGGAWVLTTHEGVYAALRDPRLSARRTGGWLMNNAPRGSAEREELTALQRIFARAMLFVDKPVHTRLRQAMQPGFRPAVIHAMQPFIKTAIEGLLDGIERGTPRGEAFDFIARFAQVLPARVISRVLGLESADDNSFIEWSAGIAKFLGSTSPTLEETRLAKQCLHSMSSYFERALAGSRSLEREGLLGMLARAEAAGDIAHRTEMLAQCTMLLFAGYETTRHFLGTSVYWLLKHPDAWSRLKADSSLIRNCVRELLRWDAPIQYTGRRVTSNFSLYGRTLRRGQLVLALIGSANRDPAEYEDPDALKLDRSIGMPLSFGVGVHACIGANLTLMETEAAIASMLKRWPDLRLAQNPPWVQLPLYRGLQNLYLATND